MFISLSLVQQLSVVMLMQPRTSMLAHGILRGLAQVLIEWQLQRAHGMLNPGTVAGRKLAPWR